MKRRDFCKSVGMALVLQACGKSSIATSEEIEKKTIFRFAVASDWHYGEANTNYLESFDAFKLAFKEFSKGSPSEFLMMNGDIIHNTPSFLTPAANLLKTAHQNIYVTQGNHDRVTESVWEEAWGIKFNHDFTVGNQAVLLGTTVLPNGTYTCPNLNWFEQKLEQYKNAQNIFIFLHITPVKWTSGAVDCLDFQKMLEKYPNVRAVFNGHDHEQDHIKMLGKIPFMFDGHICGSWGTAYKGFRIVELKEDNSMVTFMMNPYNRINRTTF